MIALVLGGAACLLEDVAALEAMLGRPWPGLVVAVNEAGANWPRRLDVFCTLHPDKMATWRHLRARNGFPSALCHLAQHGADGVDRAVEQRGPMIGGSSGLFAVFVALEELGASRVVLCGVPMDWSLNGFTRRHWLNHGRYRRGWVRSKDTLRGRVFSMSGWTKDLLGAPHAGLLAAA